MMTCDVRVRFGTALGTKLYPRNHCSMNNSKHGGRREFVLYSYFCFSSHNQIWHLKMVAACLQVVDNETSLEVIWRGVIRLLTSDFETSNTREHDQSPALQIHR